MPKVEEKKVIDVTLAHGVNPYKIYEKSTNTLRKLHWQKHYSFGLNDIEIDENEKRSLGLLYSPYKKIQESRRKWK